MSNSIIATCENKVVKYQGASVEEVKILSKGIGLSEGVLIMDGERKFYLVSSANDIDKTLAQVSIALEKTSNALGVIANSLTAIAGNMNGPSTSPPPAIPNNVVQINQSVSEINQAKSALDEIKGSLL